MTGIVPGGEFNEQLKRTVRESIRRERPNVGPPGRWHKKGGGGASRRLVRICSKLDPRGEVATNNDVELRWSAQTAYANVIGYIAAHSQFFVNEEERIIVHNIWRQNFEHHTIMIVESILGLWVPSVSDCTGEEFDSADECFDNEVMERAATVAATDEPPVIVAASRVIPGGSDPIPGGSG